MKHIFICFLLVFHFSLFAQENYRSGYVITNSKDTLSGLVDYAEGALNPSTFSFKKEQSARVRSYSIDNSRGFGIDMLVSYERAMVNISTASTEGSSLSTTPDTSVHRATVFLRLLRAGKNVDLLSYTDQVKTRYYIQEFGESEPVELILNVHLASGEVIREKRYQTQLLALLSKYSGGQLPEGIDISWVNYTDRDIAELVKTINGHTLIRPELKKVFFFFGLGLSQTTVNYTGSHQLGSTFANSKHSNAPMAVVGVDLIPNPASGRLLFRIDASIFTSTNEISSKEGIQSSTTLTHTFKQKAVALSPQLIYNLYNSRRLKFYIGAGIGGNISAYSENIYTTKHESGKFPDEIKEAPIELSAFNLYTKGMTGILFNKRVELSGAYYPKSALASNAGFKTLIQRFTVGVNYHFGKQ